MGRIVEMEKKEYKKDKYGSWFCAVIYAMCILGMKALNYVPANSNTTLFYFVVGAKMFAIVVIIGLNYCMIVGSKPDEKLLKEINEFDMRTENKNDLKKQRDTLTHCFDDSDIAKNVGLLVFIEVIICICVWGIFIKENKIGEIIINSIVDFEAILMTILFYRTEHYKFMIRKNLRVKNR